MNEGIKLRVYFPLKKCRRYVGLGGRSELWVAVGLLDGTVKGL